jgi:hypothetical protein
MLRAPLSQWPNYAVALLTAGRFLSTKKENELSFGLFRLPNRPVFNRVGQRIRMHLKMRDSLFGLVIGLKGGKHEAAF